MSNPKLYMMCGISGSGKTTFARQFAAEQNLRYLNPDDFYALYNGDECDHTHEFEIWMALYRALHMAEQDGVSVIFDTNAPTVVDRSQILDWFPTFEHHLICVIAPEELCRANNQSRRRVIPDHVMERMIQNFQQPNRQEWLLEPRWQSITMLDNESNHGIELTSRFYRGNTPPITRTQIDKISQSIQAAEQRRR